MLTFLFIYWLKNRVKLNYVNNAIANMRRVFWNK